MMISLKEIMYNGNVYTYKGNVYTVVNDWFKPCILIDCVQNIGFYKDIDGFYFAVIHAS